MTVLITLTTAGLDAGPFDLYSNIDAYSVPFQTGVSKSALLAGYTSTIVPDSTTTVRVRSTGTCTNYIDIPISGITTTTSSSTSTSTTSTTVAPSPSITAVPSCNSTNGTTVTKRWVIAVSNPPNPYTINANITGGSANVTIVTYNGSDYVQAIFNPSLSTEVSIRLQLKNQAGQEVAYNLYTIYSNYESYVPNCPL